MNTLNVQDLTPKAWNETVKLHREHCTFPLPDVSNKLYFVRKVVTDNDGRVIATALCRLTSEVILIIDKDRPHITQTRAITKLHDAMKFEVKTLGMDEVMAFADEDSARILDRLGFVPQRGKLVVKELYHG